MFVKDKKILFVHIPKTCGQSILEFILKNVSSNVDIDNNIEYGLKLNKDLSSLGPSHYHHMFLSEYYNNNFMKIEDVDSYWKFTILRDPVQRFISAYNFMELHQFYQHPLNFVDDFIKIKNKNDKLYRMFCTQSEYVEPQDKINMYYNMKNIDDVFKKLITEFNFKGSTLHKNKSNKIQQVDDKIESFIIDYYAEDFELIERKNNV